MQHICCTAVKVFFGLLALIELGRTARGELLDFSCNSDFSEPPGSALCVGMPFFCRTLFSNDNNVTVQNTNFAVSNELAEFTASEEELEDGRRLINFTINHYSFATGVFEIRLTSQQTGFTLVNTTTMAVVEECAFFLSIQNYSKECENVRGGEVFSLVYTLSSTKSSLWNLTLAIKHHSALTLNSISGDQQDHQSGILNSLSDVVGGNVLTDDDPVAGATTIYFNPALLEGTDSVVNLTFQVHSYIFPEDVVFMDTAFIYSTENSQMPFQVVTEHVEYKSQSPIVGNYSINLPNYIERDYINHTTLPPNEDDIFEMDVTVYVPCMTTRLNITISIPEFEEYWIYGDFYSNITKLEIVKKPDYLILLDENCSNASNPLCYQFENQTEPKVTLLVDEDGPGMDTAFINFGTVTCNSSMAYTKEPEDCCNCTSFNEELVVEVTGHIVYDLNCTNQTITDNVTVIVDYVNAEATLVEDEVVLPINASMPALTLPITIIPSESPDAGDSLVMIFEVLHNSEYSSFSTYNVSFEFWIDTKFEPEDVIELCHYFGSSEVPIYCKILPFVNHSVSYFYER